MADNFVLTESGDWHNKSAYAIRPNKIYKISVETFRSRFDKDRPPIFGVVLDISTVKNYRSDFAIKSFDNEADARQFAGKLANLLNQE